MNYMRLIGCFLIIVGIFSMSNYILLFFSTITGETTLPTHYIIPLLLSLDMVIGYIFFIVGGVFTSKRTMNKIKKIFS